MKRGPLFVCGVPRSGTHAIANLIARHSRYAMIPRELGFHTGMGGEGLPDLLEGRIDLDRFVELMSGHWWKRDAPWDETVTRGLYKTIPEDRYRAALGRFAEAYPADPYGATGALMHELFDPIAEEAGAETWIEMDPHSVLAAPHLHRALPDMKMIQTVRDGRDVALSLKDMPWGTGVTVPSGIYYWQRLLRRAHAALREVPEDRVLTIQLEDLVSVRREETYARVLEFLELEDEPEMHAFFDESISARNAHQARWRVSLSPLGRLGASALYAGALARVALAGVSPRPPLRGHGEPPRELELTRRPQQETIDPWADGRATDA